MRTPTVAQSGQIERCKERALACLRRYDHAPKFHRRCRHYKRYRRWERQYHKLYFAS